MHTEDFYYHTFAVIGAFPSAAKTTGREGMLRPSGRLVHEEIFSPVGVVVEGSGRLMTHARKTSAIAGGQGRDARDQPHERLAVGEDLDQTNCRLGNGQSRIKSNQIDSYTEPSDRGEIEPKAQGSMCLNRAASLRTKSWTR